MPATKPAAKPEAGKKDPEGKGPCVCMCMCIFFWCHGTGAAQKPKAEEKRAGHGQNFSACVRFFVSLYRPKKHRAASREEAQRPLCSNDIRYHILYLALC